MPVCTSLPVPTHGKLTNIHYPDLNTLVWVLENALKQHFMHVEVKCVRCPDLSQKPFNLAAPGICGNTTLLEFSDTLTMQYITGTQKIHDSKEFLYYISDNDESNSLIFGSGVSKNPASGRFGELVLNASYAPELDGKRKLIKNQSRIILMNNISNAGRYKCKSKMFSDFETQNIIQGTFFLCEGLRELVLQVHAKKFRWPKRLSPEHTSFICSMQQGLQQAFRDVHGLVALGGVYVADNISWQHKIAYNYWEDKATVPENYCKVNALEPIISIFNSRNEEIVTPSQRLSPSQLNNCHTTHCLSHHNAVDIHHIDELTEDGVNFLGYFCPLKKAYHIY